jgi:hypothetical protein
MVVGIRLPDVIREAMKSAAAERKITMEAAYTEAVRLWLGARALVIEDEHHSYFAKLRDILASHDEKAIRAVTQNIDFFHERLKPQRKKKPH